MAVTPFDVFGAGKVFVTSTTAAAPSPVNIGYSQEFSLDFTGNMKELTGQNQFSLDAARGVTKVQVKLKAAVLSSLAWNALFFGQSFTSGSLLFADNESQTVPSSGPYTITVTNASHYEAVSSLSPYGGDLGVVYAATGLPLLKVASVSAAGQYSVNPATGVYTFDSADEGAAVLISYRYTATTGQTLIVTNQLIGNTPIFQLDYYTTRNNLPFLIRLPQCAASKLTIGAKLEDFMMPEFDLMAFANAANQIAQFSYPQVA